jgi:hypothetical protein
MVTGALGASGSGFCWMAREGGPRRVFKYDMAFCNGAAEVMGAKLISYSGVFGEGYTGRGFGTWERVGRYSYK